VLNEGIASGNAFYIFAYIYIFAIINIVSGIIALLFMKQYLFPQSKVSR